MKVVDNYLICDMDETLIKVDFFVETLIRLSLFKTWDLVNIIFKSVSLVDFKKNVLEYKIIDRRELFFLLNNEVFDFINENKSKYRKVILVSASPNDFVKKIAREIGLFDEAHGSTDINLKGGSKLEFIKDNNWVPFDYLGDSKSDEIIFKFAKFYIRF